MATISAVQDVSSHRIPSPLHAAAASGSQPDTGTAAKVAVQVRSPVMVTLVVTAVAAPRRPGTAQLVSWTAGPAHPARTVTRLDEPHEHSP